MYPFDPELQDMLDNVADITHMVDDIVNDVPTDTAPTDVTVAPPFDFLPDVSYPDPVFIPDLIHPDEFTLNGFPYDGQDPTEPGYWSLPSL
jgi:hypothetical protein